MNEFIIEFTYQGSSYTGLVSPKLEGDDDGYEVKLENANQEVSLDILAKPCGEGKIEWCFRDASPDGNYDKDLLQEIGEAIEKYQAESK